MANNSVEKYEILIGNLYNGDVLCENQSVTPLNGADVAIQCIDPTCGKYKVQIGPGVTEPCIDFLAHCEDCGDCKDKIITKCFCDTVDDCSGACEICDTDGFCAKTCPDDECVDGVCGECTTVDDCTCNKVCENRTCNCPAGTVYNSVTECCDECSKDGDCDECELCQTVNNIKTCVPKQCTTGVCDPDTNDCVECNNSTDCTGEHECCNAQHECNCCPGFVRINGVCTDTCQFDTDCDTCEICDPLSGCIPLDCGTKVCNPATNSCEEPCDGDCPIGFGCFQGFCVKCDTLSCSGVVSLCSQAQGCICNGNLCQYENCENSDCADWVVTDPVYVPGTPVPGSGTPAPAFTVSFTQLGIVQMSGGSGSFLDYQINIVESGGNSGSWTVEGSSLGSGSSISFKLSDPTNVQWNNVGFEVNFVGVQGQTGSIVIYNTNWFGLDNGFNPDILTTPANWVVDVQGTAVNPTMNGSSFTPGSLKLCPCGTNTDIVGYSWTTIEGNLTVTFTPLPDGCVRATIQGCGVGEGTVTTECAGIQKTIPLPALPFDFSANNCCNPLNDPNCNGVPGDGYGCTSLSVLNGRIALSNTNFVTGDGFGLFRGVFQPDSIGYTIAQWIRVARNVCWSVTGTVREATSFIPPVLAHLFHDVEYRSGVGCLRLGYTCDIKVANCKKVQAEACFEGCDAFTVSILGTTPVFNASASIGNNVQISYAWSTNTGLTGTGATFTIPSPNTNITSITVVATLNVNGTICTASDTLLFALDAIQGCTNPSACNYDEGATVDDGSCISIRQAIYTCGIGFQPAAPTYLGQGYSPVITYRIGIYPVVAFSKINPSGSLGHQLDIYFDGVLKCSQQLVVPQCYECSGDACLPSPNNAVTVGTTGNAGQYSTTNCNGECDCSIFINVSPSTCNDSQSALTITPSGDTGLYTVTVQKLGVISPGIKYGPVGPQAAPFVTGLLCDGLYTITVEGQTCTESTTFNLQGCFDCETTTFDIENPTYDNALNIMHFDLVGGTCAGNYTVQVDKDGVPIVGLYQVYPGPGIDYTLPFGTFRGEGLYTLRLIDTINGCVRSVDLYLDENGEVPDSAIISCGLGINASLSTLSFQATFVLDDATDLYRVAIYNTTGPASCTGATHTTLIETPALVQGVLGLNTVNFYGLIPLPLTSTCYAVKIENYSDPSSFCWAYGTYIFPTGPSMECSGSVTYVGYDEATGQVLASWAFVNTSNNLTIQVDSYDSGVCGTGTPITVSASGFGAGGSMVPVGAIPQIQGTTQCVRVTIYDTNDVSCTATLDGTIDPCTCEVEILSAVSNPTTQSVLVEYRTKCTSGQVDIFVTGDGDDETATDNSPSEDGEWIENEITIPIGNYPSAGGTVNVELTDNSDGGCTHTINNIVLDESCVGCGQVATLYFNDSTVTQIRDESANLIVTGTYDLTTDEALLEAATESGAISQGANFCSAGTTVDVEIPRDAGILVNMDSTDLITLDYVVLTHPTDWVGTLKSYFGNCGCTGITRVCDYEVILPIGASDDTVIFYFGTNNAGVGYTSNVQVTTFSQTPSGSLLTQMQNDILTALTSLSGCDYTVASVSVTYDDGTDELTVTINGTNAAIGVITAVNNGVGVTTALGFTQSGCV